MLVVVAHIGDILLRPPASELLVARATLDFACVHAVFPLSMLCGLVRYPVAIIHFCFAFLNIIDYNFCKLYSAKIKI